MKTKIAYVYRVLTSRSLKHSMFRNKRRAGILAGILLLLTSAAATGLWGSQGYASLKIASGAREVGMGESGVAGARAASALRWNPALLMQGRGGEVSLHYNRWLVGSSRSAVLIKRKLGNRVSLGGEVIYFTSGDIELRDSISSPHPLSTYTFSDLTIGLGAAVEIVNGVRIGIVGRYFNERLWNYSGSTWGFDAGLQYEPFSGVNFGFSVLDFGFDIHLDAQGFKPPMTLRIGSAYSRDWSDKFATCVNLDFFYRPYDSEPGVRTGVEATLFKLLSLRAGLKMLYQNSADEIELFSPTELLTFGLGLEHEWVSLDYAFVPYNRLDLGLTHRVSLNLAFD